MKNPKQKKYMWLAIAIVAVELSVLFVKASRTYRREAANAQLTDAIARCSPADVQSALDRGADAIHDAKPRRSFLTVLFDTLRPADTGTISLFNSTPLACALAIKPAWASEVWRLNRAKIVSVLLDHGANPNGRPGYDYSPLYLAISSHDIGLTRTLLEHGANASGDSVPNAIGMKSPLILAAACRNVGGDTAIVGMLLEHGAGIDTVNMAGQSSLMLAAQLGDVNMVSMLIRLHARTELRDNAGRAAADLVPQNGIPQSDRQHLLALLHHVAS